VSDEMRALTRTHLEVSAEWETNVVATRPPVLEKHEEHSLVVRLAADSAVVYALMLETTDRVLFSRERVAAASARLDERLHFFPRDWDDSDEVQISFGANRLWVTSPELKEDPRSVVAVSSFDRATTGSVVEVATLRSPFLVRVQIFTALRSEVLVTRSRWRVAPERFADLPEAARFLSSGRQSGDFTIG
jgi:hypothetical protein